MRRAFFLWPALLLASCFEFGSPGERAGDTHRPCDECVEETPCPAGERCAPTGGLHFRGPALRACGRWQLGATLGRAVPPLAAGGRMTLEVTGLSRADVEPGAALARGTADVLRVGELVHRDWRTEVEVFGEAPGTAMLEVRRVDGDLLIDRLPVSVRAVARAAVVPPGIVGCSASEVALYRPLEAPLGVVITDAEGEALADEGAALETRDGLPVTEIPAGLDRIALVVVAGGQRFPAELPVVDRADTIARADPIEETLIQGPVSSLFRCYRALRESHEVVGAAFTFERLRSDGTASPLAAAEDAPQCVEAGALSPGTRLRILAAGAERIDAVAP